MGSALSMEVIASVGIPEPREVRAAVSGAMQDEIGDLLVESARDGWPRRTGRSADAWTGDLSSVDGQPSVEVANRAASKHGPYAGYVRRNQSAPLASAEAMERMTDTMANTGLDLIIDAINRTLEG